MSDSEGDCNSPIPSVNERLGQLRPSRELLEYYRKKVADFDNEHDEMVAKLDAYKVNYEDQHRMECELTQREQEISDLQKAISDLQVCVLQEREQVLRLYAENDRLKIREVGDRKRIQHLLALAGPAAAEVSYFHKDPPSKIVIPQKLPKSQLPNEDQSSHKKKPLSEIQNKPGKSPKPTVTSSTDNQSLALQVEALQAQLEEQTKLARDQVSALLEERRIMQEESDLARERDRDRYERYAKRLREAQNLLHESTQDVLTLKRSHRGEEKEWMAEKDNLLQEMDLLRDHLDAVNLSNHGGKPTSAAALANVCANEFEARAQLEAEVAALEQQLDQAGKLADMYREQCILTEDELSRMREEAEVHRWVGLKRDFIGFKVAVRLKLMTIRYAALEKRRSSEVEGFKTDVKNLRKRLKEVEKQLYKVTVGDTVSDAHVLQTVHATAGRSRAIQNELKTLKGKIYSLEGDLRGIY
ncbi:coiled-coil domain-containing protein 77 [Ciona intestinalis]